MTNQSPAEGKKITDPYPSLTWEEKIEAYKQDIKNSLDFACHPKHLDNVRRKLDNLQQKWSTEWEIK